MGNTQSSSLGRTVAARTQVVETRHLKPRAEVVLKPAPGSDLGPIPEHGSLRGGGGSVKGATTVMDAGSMHGVDEIGTYDPEVNGILVVAGDPDRHETGADEAPDAQPAGPSTRPPTIAPAEAEQREEQQEQQQQQQEKNDNRVSETHTVAPDPATGSPGVYIKLEYESITIAGENNVVMGFSSDFLAQAQKHPTGVTFEVKCGPINVAASSRNIKVGHCVN